MPKEIPKHSQPKFAGSNQFRMNASKVEAPRNTTRTAPTPPANPAPATLPTAPPADVQNRRPFLDRFPEEPFPFLDSVEPTIGSSSECTVSSELNCKVQMPTIPGPLTRLSIALKKRLMANSAINSAASAEPIKQSNTFLDYVVHKNKPLFSGTYSDIYHAEHPMVKVPLVAREFKPTSLIKHDSFYVKLLLRIEKVMKNRGPVGILETFDIYTDDTGHIYMFQEYANYGNGMEHLKSGKRVSEQVMRTWARSIYSAMDFIVGLGVCHQSIYPKHVMLLDGPVEGGVAAKLSGFRDAVVYWDPATGDLINQRCKSATSRKNMFFHSPESFGVEGEYFNPVDADVWSFGTSMFFFVSRKYPFNVANPSNNIDEEIRASIGSCTALSTGAKQWLFGLMRANPQNRTPFEAIAENPWFKAETTNANQK